MPKVPLLRVDDWPVGTSSQAPRPQDLHNSRPQSGAIEAGAMDTPTHSTNCYEWTIGQWEQVPRPLVPKTCTTLVPKGTIVAGAVTTASTMIDAATRRRLASGSKLPGPSTPRPLQPSLPKGTRKLAAQLYPPQYTVKLLRGDDWPVGTSSQAPRPQGLSNPRSTRTESWRRSCTALLRG